jgi:N-acylneuraminate cytidylyltransferase
MNVETPLFAVIPARGGSKGLPQKNIRPFVGLPLIAHSILFAKRCPEITRCIVSTDSEEIAEVAKRYGADVPFLRPAALAQDDSTIWGVLRHALETVEQQEGRSYEALVLLDPTSPAREPSDLAEAWRRLCAQPQADGVIGVSRPDFNPVWHCVIERDGWMADLDGRAASYEHRQEAPVVYRINGSLYVWRTAFLRREPDGLWRQHGKHLLYEIPERRAMSIDTAEQFERAEVLVKAGVIKFPWMTECPVA